jgi:hypothetical protein
MSEAGRRRDVIRRWIQDDAQASTDDQVESWQHSREFVSEIPLGFADDLLRCEEVDQGNLG